MTISFPPRPARRRRSRVPRWAVGLLLLAVIFAAGIALGEALHDNPRPGETRTRDRTLTVYPRQRTVTVTAP